MEDKIEKTASYLTRFDSKPHILARIIREHDVEAGMVHTPAEIAQQPHMWRITVSQIAKQADKLKLFLHDAGIFDSIKPQIIFTGAGTSDYVGQSLVDLFRITFNTQVINWPTPRITANPDDFFDYSHKYLLIHFARSGNSPESKAVLNMTLDKLPDNVHHIVITSNKNGELACISRENPDKVYLITLHEDSNDKGLAMTSSFSSMVVAGQSLVHLDDMDAFVNIIENMAKSAEYFIDMHADDIYGLANPSIDRAFFLGNKDLLGAATESALKVQELTAGQIFAISEDTLSFRHGPVSAVDKGSLVCFFLSEDPLTRKYELDVIKQYDKAFFEMGAISVVFASNHKHLFNKMNIHFFSYDPEEYWNIPAYYQVNLAVLFGQLFGMFQACRRNINVDDPSSVKATYNRIVQGVELYEH